MFRAELKEKLEKIFGVKKVTFDAPSDQFEQDTMFIEITNPRVKIGPAKVKARVTGAIVMYSQDNKMPYGFFAKRIEKADPLLTKKFFFFDVDQNKEDSPARLINISERRTSFVFLYEAQYDPNVDYIESFESSIESES